LLARAVLGETMEERWPERVVGSAWPALAAVPGMAR
jgi:hypothetical protein